MRRTQDRTGGIRSGASRSASSAGSGPFLGGGDAGGADVFAFFDGLGEALAAGSGAESGQRSGGGEKSEQLTRAELHQRKRSPELAEADALSAASSAGQGTLVLLFGFFFFFLFSLLRHSVSGDARQWTGIGHDRRCSAAQGMRGDGEVTCPTSHRFPPHSCPSCPPVT